MIRMRWFLVPLTVLAAAGCSGTSAPTAPAIPCQGLDLQGQAHDYVPLDGEPCRVFYGRLRLPQQKQLPLPDRPFQVAAVGFTPIAGAPATTDAGAAAGDSGTTAPGQLTDEAAPLLFYGDPFRSVRGGGQRDATPFAVVVPCTVSVNLLLQVPRTSGDKMPGLWVAAMTFAPTSGTGTTTLIPRQTADICAGSAAAFDLGLVDLELGERDNFNTGTITLGKGNSNNPLSLVPPPEGQTSEQDLDGDGIVDSAELLSSLPDVFTPGEPDDGKPHPDGIPDLFQQPNLSAPQP